MKQGGRRDARPYFKLWVPLAKVLRANTGDSRGLLDGSLLNTIRGVEHRSVDRIMLGNPTSVQRPETRNPR